jgi:hypothetical protein
LEKRERRTTILAARSCVGFAGFFFFCPGLGGAGAGFPDEGKHRIQYAAWRMATVGARPRRVLMGSATRLRKAAMKIARRRMGWRLA